MTNEIKCEGCGQFIAYKDLNEGRATYHQEMQIIDMHGGINEYEYNLCAKCSKSSNHTERKD